MATIRGLQKALPKGERLLYEDEIDIHLNPKIGLDWMPKGVQREVVTPGKNRKAYLAGALDAQTGQLIAVEGARKTTALFIALLEEICLRFPEAKVLHVVLDNYGIHHSKRAKAWLRDRGARIRLHFLPPYSPNDNPIERVWQDLHAEVTRNHTRRALGWLLRDVWRWLAQRSKQALGTTRRRVA
jgi:transposase